MGSAAATRATRAPRRICIVCLKGRATMGRPTCAECRDAINERSAKRYEAARKAKRCTRSGCEEPADGYLCETHAAQRRKLRAQ